MLAPVNCGYQTIWLVFSPDNERKFASYLKHIAV